MTWYVIIWATTLVFNTKYFLKYAENDRDFKREPGLKWFTLTIIAIISPAFFCCVLAWELTSWILDYDTKGYDL